MVADILSSLLEANNLILIGILVLLFIIGYKLMKAVMQLFLIAIFSGLFLVAMGYTGIGPELTITRFILFMALGVGLYMGYNTLATATNVASILWSVIHTIIDTVTDILGAVARMVGSVVGGSDEQTATTTDATSSDDGSTEKMAILEEVDEDE